MAYMRNGLAAYVEPGNWAWQFFPPPYDFLAPPRVIPAPGVILPEDRLQAGLGGCGCGGKKSCGGGCGCGGGCSCGGACGGGLGDDSTDSTVDQTMAPTVTLSSVAGDLSNFASNLTTSVNYGPLQTLSTSYIANIPAWVWLAGGVVLYMWLFTGGKGSRVSRAKQSVKRTRSRAAGLLPRYS